MAIKILCIETSTDICSVCVSKDGSAHGVNEFKEFRHSSHLLPLILESLKMAEVPKSELDAVCLSRGPGSYTGLRVGASTAKALAYALDISLISIDTLTALANGIMQDTKYAAEDLIVVPMIDARRDEVYSATYDRDLNEIQPTRPLILDADLIKNLPSDKSIIICGNGAKKVLGYCDLTPNITLNSIECSSEYLCTLSTSAFEKNQFENLDSFEPNYLKPPRITKPKSPLLKGAN